GDGGGAARERLPLDGALERIPHLVEVDPSVGEEADVLGDQDGALDVSRHGRVGDPDPLHAVVAAGRALLLAIALDERRAPGRARREGAHARPRPGLPGEPGAESEEPDEGDSPPRSPPSDRPAPARHGPSLALAPLRPSGHHGAMSLRARGQSRLAWFDRFIVPRETPIAPSRWHQHIEQRRVSRLDHLRPHRLNWEALKNPGATGAEGDETLTPRRLAGIRWSWLDGLFTTVSDNLYLGFIVLYAMAYGASTSQLGLLAAIQNLLGAVSLFPGARAADAARHRKPLVTWTVGGFARLALLALALVPWLTSSPGAAIVLIIAIN